MKLPRDLNGQTLAKFLSSYWDYVVVHQTGSHIILETETPGHQRIAIPAHKNLKVGTLHSILKSVADHKKISRQDIIRQL